MNCSKCNKPNRTSAKYCKWCGSALVASGNTWNPAIASLIGKAAVVDKLTTIVRSAEAVNRQGKQRGVDMRARLCFAITGVPGSGKNFVAEALAAELYNAGIIKSPVPKVIKSADYDKFVEKLDDNVKSVGGNVLIIDEAHKLCPNTRAETVTDLDKVLQKCRDWCDDPEKPVVLFLGDTDLDMFFEANPAARAMIQDIIEVPVPTVEDCADIAVAELAKFGIKTPAESRAKISRILNAQKRDMIDKFDFGHAAYRIAYSVFSNPANDKADVAVPDMILGKEYVPKTFDEVMADFDKFVGVEDIKKCIREIAAIVEEARERGEDPAGSVKSHFVFKGNPGTGKTTMARLFAEALHAMGALPTGQLVEVDRGKLVSEIVGKTPKLVRKAVNDAMGGVLFIDEAYNLCNGKDDDYGQQAVDTLLKDCEDLRGKFVCLIAGYPVEMDRFMGTNPGLARRFDKTVIFRDYIGPELTQIFRNMLSAVKPPVKLAQDADDQIEGFFGKMYLTRGQRFGNAGTVRNTLNDAVQRMKVRVREGLIAGTLDPSEANVMIMNDIQPQNKNSVDDILASFDDLVGMDSVKEQISDIAKSVATQRRLIEMGIVEPTVENIHIILTGNPGTGKTTVAERLGKVFKAIGVIPTDRVVVKKSEDILDSFAHSTGRNMTQAVDDAMGGILFIDEAYSLLPVRQSGDVDSSGADAVKALMTCMSEREGQFITVMAGYKIEMEEFIRNANAGLERRFTHRIHIPDYSVEDLTTIFLNQVKKNRLKISDEALELLKRKIDEMVSAKDEKFGNAGTIIKLFDTTRTRHFKNVRPDDDVEQLITITKEDIPYDAPKKLNIDEIMAQLDHLEGLKGVKEAVRDMADTLMVMQNRAAESGNKESINLDHYLFLGNPGTGKTTVARIMGNIFYSLGLLPSNKVIELSAKDLKAPYVGQTSPKAHAAMMRGMGGVVFIDEAYSITQGDGQNGFGQEAVAEILQVMENHKNKFITIAAGYPNEMREWLDSNSGLSSRFTNTITFEDYSAEELSRIALRLFEKKNLIVKEAAVKAMQNYFARFTTHKTVNFANAREARNFVDKVLLNQGRRLRSEMNLPGFNRDSYFIIEPSDMLV